MKKPLEVFNQFAQGLASGTDSWKEAVAQDIKFSGPLDTVNGIQAFTELNNNFFPLVKGMKMERALESNNTVITNVEITVNAPSGNEVTFEMAEFYEIENDKIQSIKVYYDAEELRKNMR